MVSLGELLCNKKMSPAAPPSSNEPASGNAIRKRLQFTVFVWLSYMAELLLGKHSKPNIILILADDLGYGDLGFDPFLGEGMKDVQAPSLKRMSQRGLIMTNFHAAAPVCSPSRASIMVGLFPWRLGIDFLYAGDLKKDGSDEMDHEQLPLIPNIAMTFREAGYYTAHIGKWHLGGQSHLEIPARRRMPSNCTVPGINQYGFDEYVGMSEGTGSARYHTHQRKETYHKGSHFLVKNDVPLPSPKKLEILTDRQTDEAMRVIREQTSVGKPFYLNLWYDAPHSPWVPIEPFYSQYTDIHDEQTRKYASMVSNMDMNIGRLLALVDELRLAENTFVVFTSDNGPENGAGSTGPFQGRKRTLTEGGICVPTIVQWTGRIAEGTRSSHYGMTTDLFPTFVEAAGLTMPQHIRIDGVSILPALIHASAGNSIYHKLHGDERLMLWYSHSIGFPKFTAAWSHGIKVVWNDYEGRKGARLPPSIRVYNMRNDPTESRDVYPEIRAVCSTAISDRASTAFTWKDVSELHLSQQISQMSRTAVATILHLVEYLRIKMQLYRHHGEHDWSLYHANKPYETDPACYIRKSSVSSLPWSNNYLVPEFCGDTLYVETGRPFCLCALSNCSSSWYLGRSFVQWTGQVESDVAGIAIDTRGSLPAYLSGLLSWSRFSSVCPSSVAKASAMSIFSSVERLTSQVLPNEASKTAYSQTYSHCRYFVPSHHTALSISGMSSGGRYDTSSSGIENGGWAAGGDLTDLSPFVSSRSRSKLHRNCYQRVHRKGREYVLSTTSCGQDAAVAIINHQGMSHALPVCRASLAKLMAVPGKDRDVVPYFDDNVMMAVINDVVHRRPLRFIKETTGNTKDVGIQKLYSNEIAVLDPYIYHSVRSDRKIIRLVAALSASTEQGSSKSKSASEKTEKALSQAIRKKLLSRWGLLELFERRILSAITGDGDIKIDLIVFPILEDGAWTVGFMGGITKLSRGRVEPTSTDCLRDLKLFDESFIVSFDPLAHLHKHQWPLVRAILSSILYLTDMRLRSGLTSSISASINRSQALSRMCHFTDTDRGVNNKTLELKGASGGQIVAFTKSFMAVLDKRGDRKAAAGDVNIGELTQSALKLSSRAELDRDQVISRFSSIATNTLAAKKQYLQTMSAKKY